MAYKPPLIIVMGVTGAGKSYFINMLAGSEVVKVGDSLDSCTQKCELVPIRIGATDALVLDTPGFDDTTRSDAEILEEIAEILSAQYALEFDIKGIIYIHRITDVRYSRSSVKTFEVFTKICGERAMKNVLLVTSRWNEVELVTGSSREQQLREKFWKFMLAHGSTIARFHGDRDSAMMIASQLIQKDPVVLDFQRELINERKTLRDTTAGSYVNEGLEELKAKLRDELAALDQLRRDIRADQVQMRLQIEEEFEAEKARLRRISEEQASMNKPVGVEIEEEVKKKKKAKKEKKGGSSAGAGKIMIDVLKGSWKIVDYLTDWI